MMRWEEKLQLMRSLLLQVWVVLSMDHFRQLLMQLKMVILLL